VTREYARLHNDIRQLDTDLQTLVFGNYTKFLLASETVTSMTTGLSILTDQTKALLNGFGSVSEHATEIRKDIAPNRHKIQRVLGMSGLLEGIQFISRLPVKLRAHVDIGNSESAADIWMKAERVLETQTHYESFTRIAMNVN
jgi:hypothetical protein